jgi:hypothetical protein
MKCPLCSQSTSILDTRMKDSVVIAGGVVVRKRVCLNKHRFTTEERLAQVVPEPKTLSRSSGFTLSELWSAGRDDSGGSLESDEGRQRQVSESP